HETIQRLQKTLSQCKVEGIKTNLPMLNEIVNHDQIISEQTTTSFVERHYLPLVTKNGGDRPMEEVKARMAGSVWTITVNEGEKNEAEQDVVICDSMKMEIPIARQQAGTVKEIEVAGGDFVNEGDVIVVIE